MEDSEIRKSLGLPQPQEILDDPIQTQNDPANKVGRRSFAARIRRLTGNGHDLVQAVYDIFQYAQQNNLHTLTLETATWLSDRGFGKPVQVGQLVDGEGNPVDFTIWSPQNPNPNPNPNQNPQRSNTPQTIQQAQANYNQQQPTNAEPPVTNYFPPLTAMESLPSTPPPTINDLLPKTAAHGPLRPWGIDQQNYDPDTYNR